MTDLSGWIASASGWIEQIDTFDFTREVVLDGPMERLAGDVAGKRVLDIGCGEGRFCRMLGAKGARCVGIDPTPPLLDAARQRDPTGTYILANGECLPFADAEFDVVVSYLTLIDIPDFRAAIREGARVLKPGGRFVVGNLAPHATTSPNGWQKDDLGQKTFFPIDYYMEERGVEVAWRRIRIINYHRPLSAYMQAFLSEGLLLREYLEPVPTSEQLRANPEWEHYWRVPYAMAMLWENPG